MGLNYDSGLLNLFKVAAHTNAKWPQQTENTVGVRGDTLAPESSTTQKHSGEQALNESVTASTLTHKVKTLLKDEVHGSFI